MKLSTRVGRIQPSITLALDARAKAMQAAGEDVVNLTVGEPDFPAPRVVQEAVTAKVGAGVRYTPAAGTPGLRQAIADHLFQTRGVRYQNDEVTVCHSCKHAISGALAAVAEDGDEVLVPVPAWASYFDLILLTGARPVPVAPRRDGQGLGPDPEALRAAVTPRTRALLFNSPNNPSGYVWTREETELVARFALEHELWLFSDEIYRPLVYTGPPAVSPVECVPESRDCTAILDGASKRYAMTGYRIGFVAGPAVLTEAVGRIHSQTTGSPNALGQEGDERALREEPPELETMRATYARRLEVVLAELHALGLETPEPRGAFYAFPNVERYLDDEGSVGFCEALLEEERVALVPGEAFGMETHVRLSYATDEDTIRTGLRRLGAFLGRRQGAR